MGMHSSDGDLNNICNWPDSYFRLLQSLRYRSVTVRPFANNFKIMNAGVYNSITLAVEEILNDLGPGRRFVNKWLPAETWVQALKIVRPRIEITTKEFNKAMATEKCKWSQSMLRFDGTNDTGVYRVLYKKTKFYYITPDKKKPVRYPSPLDAEWKDRADAAGEEALNIPVTRSRPAAPEEDTRGDVAAVTTARKRQRRDEPQPFHITPSALPQQIYWQSRDASEVPPYHSVCIATTNLLAEYRRF
jgi:hypothetical protein